MLYFLTTKFSIFWIYEFNYFLIFFLNFWTLMSFFLFIPLVTWREQGRLCDVNRVFGMGERIKFVALKIAQKKYVEGQFSKGHFLSLATKNAHRFDKCFKIICEYLYCILCYYLVYDTFLFFFCWCTERQKDESSKRARTYTNCVFWFWNINFFLSLYYAINCHLIS